MIELLLPLYILYIVHRTITCYVTQFYNLHWLLTKLKQCIVVVFLYRHPKKMGYKNGELDSINSTVQA